MLWKDYRPYTKPVLRGYTMQIVTAPEQFENYSGPTIFLAGAITGAPNWQPQAAQLLQPAFATIFNPRRATRFKQPDEAGYLESYRQQVEWEHAHLLAADIVLFWMPKEAEAITTRFELGWWFGKHFFGNTVLQSATPRFVVGIEPGVKGDMYYRVVLPKYGLPVFDTLEETCQAANKIVITS